MAVLLDISTAVPEYSIAKEDLLKFYVKALETSGIAPITKKLSFVLERTKINHRHSCIPDFEGKKFELFTDANYRPSIDNRMQVYKKRILPLASKAIETLFLNNAIEPVDITHLITVSCTGLYAPGLEFSIADEFGLEHTEKLALNFIGCYAAIKALKHAHYIAQAHPEACILIVSAELCSLHFYPSVSDEDILSNLLFADGAAAAIVCGNSNSNIKNTLVLNIDSIGSARIPKTAELMTWDISSTAFRMFLSRHLVDAIQENIQPVVHDFTKENTTDIDYWAIHPGGVRIVEAVKESLHLHDSQVEDSMRVLQQYGNMSSPTILFILQRILHKLRRAEDSHDKTIFACAFGPGITVEMIQFSSVDTSFSNKLKEVAPHHAVQA